MLIQVLSMFGAVLMLGAYVALQLKRLTTDSLAYQVLNFVGATLLTIAAVTVRQAGLIAIEGAWAVISLAAMVRVIVSRRAT
jgi:hypothetical protein